MRPLLIVGTGGLAKEVAQLARAIDPDKTRWSRLSYVAEQATDKGKRLAYGAVDFCDDEAASVGPADIVIAMANGTVRRRLAERYTGVPGAAFPTLIHPSVSIDPEVVTLGRGTIVAQGVIMTCDIVAGEFNIFNKGCQVGHDVRIGSFTTINPAATVSGGARIGNGCLIGVGARVLEKLQVANGATLAAGSVLMRDIVEENHVFAGMPARLSR